MSDLPPDLERLRVIRTYLQLKLNEVDARIAQIETGAESWAVGPATAWKIQHLPSPTGARGRGVLHRDSCLIDGTPVSREEAIIALDDGDTTPCSQCRPEEGLRD